MIRRATVADVPAMGSIINAAAEYGLMLHRSQAYLFENVRDFQVAVDDDDASQVVGVCGLAVVWANIAEVYALAVAPSQRGKGIGAALVRAALEDAREVGIPRVMSLTYEQRFFEWLGFSVVDRQTLPLKVWSQCIHCMKNDACDEIAMIHVLEGVPEPKVETPPTGNADASSFDVPVPITIGQPSATHDGRRPKMDEAP